MIDTIYFEREIEGHSRSQELFARFPKSQRIPCDHYKEVFNPRGQNFRLQKKNPSLILSQNKGKLLHEIPSTYGIGGKRNFYFSHLLNCMYDCRYCFLQGMFSSAHYVLFVNYEDYWDEICLTTEQSNDSTSWFFSGYDCDSLAMESITGFAEFFLPKFRVTPEAFLELRTKSVNTSILKNQEPLANVVVAFSFTPQEISEQLEHGVPSIESRLKAIHELSKLGWQVGVRIDPVIDCEEFEKRYRRLFKDIFEEIRPDNLHSVSLGAFRMPIAFFKKMEKLYPKEPLFAGNLTSQDSNTSYHPAIEKKRISTCRSLLLEYVSEEKLFHCELNIPG